MLTQLEADRLKKLIGLFESLEHLDDIQSKENLQFDIEVYNKLSKWRKMFAEVSKKNRDLNLINDSLYNSNSELSVKNEWYTDHIDSIKTECQMWKDKVGELVLENTHLIKREESSAKKMEEIRNSLTTKRETNELLEKIRKDLADQVSNLAKDNRDLVYENLKLRTDYCDLFSRHDDLVKQVESLTSDQKFDEKYQSLREVLDLAYEQAASGKGHERHGSGLPFEQQPMQTICRDLGSSEGMAFQVTKKLLESYRLPTLDAKIRELLGAINYVAGMIIFEKAKSNQV